MALTVAAAPSVRGGDTKPRGPLRPPLRPPPPSAPGQPLPTTLSPTTRRTSAPPWHPDLERAIRSFAARLKRRFATEITQAARAFKKFAVYLLKRHLPPGPGRVPEEAVTRAINLRKQGRPWPEVYLACIPNYTTFTPAERHYAASKLRTARRSRLNTRKRRAKSYHTRNGAR